MAHNSVHRPLYYINTFFRLFFTVAIALDRTRTMPHPDLSIPLLPDAEHDLPLPHRHHHPHYTWPEAGPSSPRATSSSAGFLGNVDAEYAYTHRGHPLSKMTGDGRGGIRERQGNGQAEGRQRDEGEDGRDADGDTHTDSSKAGIFGAKAIAAMTGAMATSLLSAFCVPPPFPCV